MLSVEQTEMLTKVGPGTPMGELLRRYWTPILLLEELPEPDCPPVRVRIFCEDLIAFRDSQGRLASWRSSALTGRPASSSGATRRAASAAPYHGWKYDVSGNCIDMPTESPEEQLQAQGQAAVVRDKGRRRHHLGLPRPQGVHAAGAPEVPVMDVPEEHRLHTKYLRECNFAQAIDGGIDSVHTNFLHAGLDRYRKDRRLQGAHQGQHRPRPALPDGGRRAEVHDEANGLRPAGRRAQEPGG